MDTFRKGCFCYKADSLPFITQKSNTEMCFLYKGKDLRGKKKSLNILAMAFQQIQKMYAPKERRLQRIHTLPFYIKTSAICTDYKESWLIRLALIGFVLNPMLYRTIRAELQ